MENRGQVGGYSSYKTGAKNSYEAVMRKLFPPLGAIPYKKKKGAKNYFLGQILDIIAIEIVSKLITKFRYYAFVCVLRAISHHDESRHAYYWSS